MRTLREVVRPGFVFAAATCGVDRRGRTVMETHNVGIVSVLDGDRRISSSE